MPRTPLVFSARFFWPPRCWYLNEILIDILPRFSARFWPPRLWDLPKILLEILSRFLASFWPLRFWDLVEILAGISTRLWDLGKNLGEFLAAEILRSRHDLVENLGEFLAAEISVRSRQSCRPKLAKILAEISVKILLGTSPNNYKWQWEDRKLRSVSHHYLWTSTAKRITSI